ncbi:MAG: 30S ribosomal protein S12 methylthiotransferase RimO [Methylotetracoccus sp.]
MSGNTPRVGFVSLGCPKALVDSERILTKLRSDGYLLVPTYKDADLVVVNTCGFIDSAVEESLDAIGEALAENGRVVVTGCLGAKADQIRARHPGVLDISGAHAYEQVVGAVHAHLPPPQDPFDSLVPPEGIKLTPRHYAYLKISEGCNHRCTFCIIPSLRGDLVSRPIGEVMDEAENLVDAGVKELLIVSQDTSAYGVDVRYRTGFWECRPLKTRFFDLAKALGALGIWVRMHYVYPYPHVDEVIPLMAEGRILPYLDVPFQHASPDVLRRMKRPAAAENALRSIERWRAICPDITLRSTFIVGFPGETDADFDCLLDFLRAAELDRVGCFKYSPVDGAEANGLADPVPDDVADERYRRFMETQSAISAAKLAAKVGTNDIVLIDEVVEEGAVGRTRGDAPDIDGQVFLDGATYLTVGDFVEVEFEEADEHDLWAHLV